MPKTILKCSRCRKSLSPGQIVKVLRGRVIYCRSCYFKLKSSSRPMGQACEFC